MSVVTRHFSRCFIAGIVALLPIGGTVLSVVYLEVTLSESWLADQPWYFPGLGLLATAAIIYLIGLTVRTFLGRWLWKRIDAVLHNLPALGSLYQTLKQIMGYGEGKDAIFQQVVLVRNGEGNGEEMGLVTNAVVDDGGDRRLVVFVPGSPNPTTGRLLVLAEEKVRRVEMPVSDALRSLVSVGKSSAPGVAAELE